MKSKHIIVSNLIIKFIIILFAIILVIQLFPHIQHCIIDNNAIPIPLSILYHWGGFLSGVFAGLAFIVVLVTAYHQRDESKKSFAQQQEFYQSQLKKADLALELQKDINNRQSKDENIRRFEDTFYKMLTLQQAITNELYANIDYIDPTGKKVLTSKKGREIFNELYRIGNIGIDESMASILGIKTPKIIREGAVMVIKSYGIKGYRCMHSLRTFDHYFRHLYRIIKFVDNIEDRDLSEEQKYEYVANIRATLSDYELIWLFFNCLSMEEVGEPRFKAYAEKYTLFNNIRSEFVINFGKYSTKYKPTAFKRG